MPRNSSGTYSLPSGNPVQSGTLIDATWANNTLNDLANEITDSLSRTAEGGMLAPLRLTDGVQATPGLAFTNEPSTGLYRAGTNEMWAVVGGAQQLKFTNTGLLVPASRTVTFNNSAIACPNDLSFDSDTLYIDATNDRVGIGTSTPYATLTVVSAGTNNTRGIAGEHYDNTTAFSQFKFVGSRARGNRGNPSAVLADDSLASFNGRGYKATGWSNTVGGMYIYAAENWTDTATGTYMTFRGAAPGGTTVSEWMKISNGNLGIGTSSPAQKLDVSGTVNSVQARFGNVAGRGLTIGTTTITGTNDAGVIFNAPTASDGTLIFQTQSVERARIDSSGNLGLGVTPSAWRSGARAFQSGANSYLTLWEQSNGSTNLGFGVYEGGANTFNYTTTGDSPTLYSQLTGAHKWFTAPSGTAGNAITFTQAMTLDASSNLMVGDTTASGRLTVKRSTDGTIGYFDGSTTQFKISVASSTINLDAQNGNGVMAFQTNGSERARITAGGDMGVGETSPDSRLEVVKAITFSNVDTYPQLCVKSATGSTGKRLNLGVDDTNTLAFIQAVNRGSGEIPLVLQRYGGEVIVNGTTDNGAYNLQCNGTGVWGAGAYVNGSDERLKDNIQSLDSGLDVVKAMRAVTFQYKPEHSSDQSVQPGFIAQELQQAMAGKPYLEGVVQSGPEYLNVAYQNIIPILVKAIQELEAKVAALEAA